MESNSKAQRPPQARGKASTLEVLGTPVEFEKIPPKWADHQARLLRLRDQMRGNQNARAETAREEVPSFSEHMADAATDSYDRDWALAVLSSDQNVLFEIEQALQRIVSGTYGLCELTGRPIEAARLKAVPWTRFSAAAQAELEAKGAVSRIQLGELGTYAQTAAAAEANGDDGEETSSPAGEKEAA
jgi:RNA polymerase-binding transcription factor DksA